MHMGRFRGARRARLFTGPLNGLINGIEQKRHAGLLEVMELAMEPGRLQGADWFPAGRYPMRLAWRTFHSL
jgi:hypothetical protein